MIALEESSQQTLITEEFAKRHFLAEARPIRVSNQDYRKYNPGLALTVGAEQQQWVYVPYDHKSPHKTGRWHRIFGEYQYIGSYIKPINSPGFPSAH